MYRREELIAALGRADSVRDVFASASARLRRLVPFDAAVWMAADPATTLPSTPTRTENLIVDGGVDSCLGQWEREFLVEDVTLYGDLARQASPAGGLQLATRHRPARSARYRDFLRPHGFQDELRAALRVDGAAWALVSLFRERGRPPFDGAETELLAGLSAPLADAVRGHARADVRPRGAELPGPGLMVFSPDGELVSYNDDALAWIEQLPDGGGDDDQGGVRLPLVVMSTLMCARAVAERREHRPARARLRRPGSGRWLVCHASCLRDGDGRIGNTALVIEPAQAAEIAPIVVEAYELSPREREITELIAEASLPRTSRRGCISPRTPCATTSRRCSRKVGVSSRGELVAKLFAEHYAPLHPDPSGFDRT